jgi:hypothetical protein
MYAPIQEPIAMVGSYLPSRSFQPKKFQWREKEFRIEQVTWKSDLKDGSIKKRLYSVMANGNLFRLEFNRENESWTLCEIWVENGV